MQISCCSKEAALKPGERFWIYAQSEIYWGDKDRIKQDRMQRCFRSHGVNQLVWLSRKAGFGVTLRQSQRTPGLWSV